MSIHFYTSEFEIDPEDVAFDLAVGYGVERIDQLTEKDAADMLCWLRQAFGPRSLARDPTSGEPES